MVPGTFSNFSACFRVPGWCPQPVFKVTGADAGSAESINGFVSDRPTDGMTIKRHAMPAKWDWPYAAPVTRTVPAQVIDWEAGDTHQCTLPNGPVAGKGGGMIELIPYGCAKFRVSMFPVTARAWGRVR